MTLRRVLASYARGDVNAVLPALIVMGSAVVALVGRPLLGAGIAAGALGAYLNSGLLVKRIQLAASTGDPAGAMIAMQVGMLVTFLLAGGITVAMLFVSVTMTVAMAIAFFVTQTLELALYYRSRRGRVGPWADGSRISGSGA